MAACNSPGDGKCFIWSLAAATTGQFSEQAVSRDGGGRVARAALSPAPCLMLLHLRLRISSQRVSSGAASGGWGGMAEGAVSALSADAEGRLLPGLAASLRAMHGERYELERDALDVLCFPRMRHGDEDFTSTMYTRAVTRISYNVALASSEADAFEYGRVEAYYLIWDPATHCACAV
ncbi:hypothetical protein CYMTET_22938 [Cymbomonas tetramitiformis]|uniref:Uncharacterized protein n=1 Tax=Cymbomonas tetramitiformis TaxID=36881 RepID=A0AAE0FZB1_9CHLO|nr:hypothetical protein CYMTET_22938 [Cymbomonas tetramitiformis]